MQFFIKNSPFSFPIWDSKTRFSIENTSIPFLKLSFSKEHKLNVQYAPTVPTIRPSKGQGELTCLTDSNPEPTYMWKLPNGQVTSGTTIKLMVRDCKIDFEIRKSRKKKN